SSLSRPPDVRPWPNPGRVALAALGPFAILVVGLILAGHSFGLEKESGILWLGAAAIAAIWVMSRTAGGARSGWEWVPDDVREIERSYISLQRPTLIDAWSVARVGCPSPKAIAAVQEKVKAASVLDGEIVAAAALLALARGDRSEARTLFE